MKPTKISPEDPRLTAYALGELDLQESALIQAAIQNDPAAREAVAEIRAFADELESALADEPIEGLPALPADEAEEIEFTKKVTPFPYWTLGAAVAACFALIFAFQQHRASRVAAVAPVASSPAAAKTLPAADSALSAPATAEFSRHRTGLPDGFSDVKPATFREDGLKLGKSVAQSEYSPSLNFGQPSRSPALVYNRDAYAYEPAHGFADVSGFPLSMFSPSEATSSYQSVANYLQAGHLPPPDAVRVEELLNYFSHSSEAAKADLSLAASIEVAAAPWNPAHRLVRIGVTGRDAGPNAPTGVAVAKDVKVQVEFNPEQAKSYRLLGYDDSNRKPAADAHAAQVPGVELEAGHVVTALYEVVPVAPSDAKTVDGDPLRYGPNDDAAKSGDPRHRELLTLKIRYKLPVVELDRKMEIPLIDTGKEFALASKDFKFDAAVARFGMLLKESPKKSPSTYDQVLTWAEEGQDKADKSDKRHEFIDLVKKTKDATVE